MSKSLVNSLCIELRYAKECIIDMGYRFYSVPVETFPSETMEERVIRLLTIKE